MPLRFPRPLFDWASRTCLIASSGRSGSTWLAERINCRGDFRIIWEPLNVEQVPQTRIIGPRRYLRPDDPAPAEYRAMRRVLDGRLRGPWIDSFNPRWCYTRRLVKVIRGNLMLVWVRRRFPHVPIVLLLRHPGAVVDSWRRQPWKQHLSAEPMLAQPDLVADHRLERWRGWAKSPVHDMLLAWCIENTVPLRDAPPGSILTVFYEHLVQDPAGQLQRIMTWIGQPYDPAAAESVRIPSALAGNASALHRGDDPVTDWTRRLDNDTQRTMLDLLAAFGLDHLYGLAPWPLPAIPQRQAA